MGLSNKNLALLLVLAIVISLVATFTSLKKLDEIVVVRAPPTVTGRALAGTGQVNLTIATNASCTVDSNVNFGSSGKPGSAITISTQSANSGTFTDCSGLGTNCSGIIVNNTGNVNINITFNSTQDGAAFLGGGHTAADFKYFINQTAPEADGCPAGGPTLWTTTPTALVSACNRTSYQIGNNTFTLEFNVSLDQNTPAGLKTTNINVICVES